MRLQGRGIEMRFGPTPALRGADLCVERGQVVAIQGPSGSGKTTFLHCLGALLTPHQGSVELDGRRIDHLKNQEKARLRRTSFGFVFQFGELVPELTLVENIAMPLLLNGSTTPAATREAAAWAQRLEIGSLADRLPAQVSGGQAQRAAVARALIHHPSVIFADEPTGALDQENGQLVLDALVHNARDLGTAIVLVTHDDDVAERADVRYVMRDGVCHAERTITP
jgi:putative ABC transport system ATP-binding protein